MILRLSSGSVTPASAARKSRAGVHDLQVDAGRGDEVLLDLLGLARAQQPVIDEHAGQPGADGPLDQRGGDRGVARRRTGRRSRRPVADLRADQLGLLVDDARAWSSRRGSPAASRKRRSIGHARARCAAPRDGTARRTGPGRRPRRRRPGVAVGARGDGEARRRDRAGVTVRHPDLLAWPAARPAARRRRHSARSSVGGAVLAGAGVADRRRRGRGPCSWKP